MSERIPEYIAGSNGLTLRRWAQDDAPELVEAVADSIEHLRPWMPWIAQSPFRSPTVRH